MSKELSKEQLDAKELYLEGKTPTEIANILWEKATKESTIRGWIKRGLLDDESEDTTPEDPQDVSDDNLEEMCNSEDWCISNLAKRLRSAQRTNNQLRKVQRELFDSDDSARESLLDGITRATNNMPPVRSMEYTPKGFNLQDATLEILFSDLQIGKVSRFYNSEIAKKAVIEYGEGILSIIKEKESKYYLEKVVFAMIGDIVEDHMKHGVASSVSTDTGLSEQMHDAIECIWSGILAPLAQLGIPIEVMCVTGNHGSSQHKGMDSFMAGRFSYDYVIYKTLQRYCELSNYHHVTFNIPDGTFGYLDIYGKCAIYEHGYHNNHSEKGMVDQKMKRGAQIGKHASYWRQGDKHHHITYGQGSEVLNGAFFGIDKEGLEYSGILGFDSIPCQTVMIHVDEPNKGKSNIKEIINVQVGQVELKGVK